jgi:hypothetical protein
VIDMADAAIFIGWGQTVRGREAKALQVFGEATAYYAKLQAAGTIESFEPVILTAHGGDLAGFVLVRGEAAKLEALKQTEDWRTIQIRAGLIVDNLGVIDAAIGESLTQGFASFSAQIAQLT